MLFNSIEFLVFFTGLLLILYLIKGNQFQKVCYLLASYLFYMWWNPVFILLIIFSTLLDYGIGKKIHQGAHKYAWLCLSILANLSILIFFKYFGFLSDNLFLFLQSFDYTPSWTSLNIILPIGISFYTFQTMSYSIDLYRGNIQPSKNLLDFAVFVSFFPQLIAGPIVRAAEFLPQLENNRVLDFSKSNFLLILSGLVKKVLIADNLSFFVDRVLIEPEVFPSPIIFLAALCFSIQIYCDFSGYTDIALGIVGILGFRLPQNFNKPYFAITPSEFWKRWHMTLSRWLRDYLFIPLGGNRKGSLLTFRNLMLTMLLGGLWHGAHWNFIIWGGIHGLALVLYKVTRLNDRLRNVEGKSIPFIIALFVFQYFVLLAWMVFRIKDLNNLSYTLHKLVFFDFNFNLANLGLGKMQFFTTLMILVLFAIVHLYSYLIGGLIQRWSQYSWTRVYLLFFAVAFIGYYFIPTHETPFIYFQF